MFKQLCKVWLVYVGDVDNTSWPHLVKANEYFASVCINVLGLSGKKGLCHIFPPVCKRILQENYLLEQLKPNAFGYPPEKLS